MEQQNLLQRTLLVLGILILLMISQAVHSQPRQPTIEGRFHLGAETTVFSYRLEKAQIDNAPPAHDVAVITTSQTFGLQIGGGLTESLYLGGNVNMAIHDQGGTELHLTIRPLLDYLFPGGPLGRAAIRPFLGVLLEYSYHGYDDLQLDNHYVGPGFRGGLRVFVTPRFSIDLLGTAAYLFGRQQRFHDEGNGPHRDGFNSHTFYMGFALGISGWF